MLIGLLSLNSGCYSIRKKFIRKKKDKGTKAVYVNFKEYPLKPSHDAYVNYYLFVRGWLDELTGALNKGISHKRSKRAINEAIMNIEQIMFFYNLEGKETIYPFYEKLLAIRKEVQRNPNMGQVKKNRLIRKIESFKRSFERNFNYTDAQKWIS